MGSTLIRKNGQTVVYDLPNAEASVSYNYFEKTAHNCGVEPNNVPALWQKAKKGAERAGQWAMLGAFQGVIHDYLDRRAVGDAYINEWMCNEEAGE